MKKKYGCFTILIALVIFSLVATVVGYYGSYWMDLYQRPWAYSRDSDAPLLVGKWHGNFTDPDGIKKEINLEIFVPMTSEERWAKAGRKRRRRGTSSAKRAFDGLAIVSSKLGTETYELWGNVKREDFHDFDLDFTADENKPLKVPNFYVNIAEKSHWNNDQMTLPVNFSYRLPNGTSHWSSSDHRFSKIVIVTLLRQKE